MTRRVAGVVAAVLLLAGFGVPAAPVAFEASVALAQTCDRAWNYDDYAPPSTSDGATMAWRAQTLYAADWPWGGFTSQVLWVGTDNAPANRTWVETGITFGWEGSSDFVFYTAHGIDFPNSYSETAFFSGQRPAVGTAYGFKVFDHKDGSYRVEINDSASILHSYLWSGHHPNTVDVSGGSEITFSCEPTQLNSTYVYRNRYRLKSNGIYYDTTRGSLVHVTVNYIYWCTQPVTFRYRFNNSKPSTCS